MGLDKCCLAVVRFLYFTGSDAILVKGRLDKLRICILPGAALKKIQKKIIVKKSIEKLKWTATKYLIIPKKAGKEGKRDK